MNILNFLELFILLIIAGALAVSGWFFVTRGWKETLPDNTEKKYGKIFKNWFFYWTKEKGVPKKVYYQERELAMLLVKIVDLYPDQHYQLNGSSITINSGVPGEASTIAASAAIKLEIEVEMKEGTQNEYNFFQKFPQYVYPEWVRYPLAVCATCFSSIYGSIFYWAFVAMPSQNVFEWSAHPVIASILFWIAFCLSLAVVNTALAKKYN